MIKKLTQAMLALALVGGMSACTQRGGNDTPEPNSSTGNTYMSVAISTTQPNNMLKAEDTKHNPVGEYEGRDKIEDLTVYVISLPEGKVKNQEFTNLEPKAGMKSEYLTKAWKVDAGKKEVYVLANINGTDIKTALDAAKTKSAFETAYAKAYTMTDDNGVLAGFAKVDDTSTDTYDIIAMNGKTDKPMEVVGGVKKEQAEAGTANCAKINLRRLVAQTVVTRSDVEDNLTIKATRDGKEITLATLSDLKWDVMQFEKTTYLAPMPTEDGKDATRVDYCMTPSFKFIPADLNAFTNNAASKYFYHKMSGLDVTTFTPGAKGSNVDNIVTKPMKFVTETTHEYGNKLEADGGTKPFTGYRKGNTPYVIISAKITPSDEAWAEGQKAANGDLYLGLNDGKFYSKKEDATAANGADEKNVIKYTGATCYYVAWLNPDNPADPVTSPVLRNNIYHVNIKGFKNIGYTGNPFNPGNDDPKDPNDKTPDPKETLYPVDTYMAVEIIVINWGVHSYDIEL